MKKDLGTYWVRVEYADGTGHLMKWNTGARYCYGTDSMKPLGAERIWPIYDDEDDVASNMTYMFTDGNYSCDCNRLSFLDQAHQRDDATHPCGETTKLERLTMIRPDGSERVLYHG